MPNNGFCEIVNFQSHDEIESTHEFEFYILLVLKKGWQNVLSFLCDYSKTGKDLV